MELDNSSLNLTFSAEHQVYEVKPRVAEKSNLRSLEEFNSLYHQSIHNPSEFWGKQAQKELDWFRPFKAVAEGSFAGGDMRWFVDGELNVSYNCIDRHIHAGKGNKIAIIWEGDEPTQIQRFTFNQLLQEVSRISNAMLQEGVRKGDRVAIYMPMVPEAAFVMLACTRIGAIHSVVFGGFSAESLRDRILDANAKFVVTNDVGQRGGKVLHLKQTVDEALNSCPGVEKVFLFKHPFRASKVNLVPKRDIWMNELMAKQRPYCPAVAMNSEDILFLLYTSGSTGKPKGVAHTTAGYLLHAALSHKFVFDYQEGDIYACMADIGWITGHSYIVYGPLANGATTFMFESTPLYPNASRYWDMVERHKINIFYTAPTAIRTLMSHGTHHVTKHDLSSLRILGSVGEPINPEAWIWYHDYVGNKNCAIVDTYWQTETGGHIVTPLPGCHKLKAGSAVAPFFGIDVAVLDPTTGKKLEGKGINGVLVVAKPWPGMARTLWGDHSRYLETYFKPYPGYYFTGDGCRVDEDGFIWITGRVDDVINKAGHRLSTAEIESALVEYEDCAEAAVVAIHDDIRGQAIVAYCVLNEEIEGSAEIVLGLKNSVKKHIGSLAIPDYVLICDSLPKTRSGKIMRRILRKIASHETTPKDLGDTSTLADPEVVPILIQKANQLIPNPKK
eukprot:TRINITY_DN173_c0_g1_i4.p1 TRINITY_DN173_c0_g1~~TRINITY_DN173_c0_g1_i4.p1  ORF type:complete len:672 (-),score=214.28 TRINITY_DN173_c0_g1_i4:59-2074(-)